MAFLFLKVPYDAARLLSGVEVPGEKQPTAEMHITLLYLGKGISTIDVAKAFVAASEVASQQSPFTVQVSQVSSFPANPDDGVPIICPVESPGIMEFRAKLAANFDRLHLNYSKKYEYKPHVTMAYVKEPELQSTAYAAKLPRPVVWSCNEVTMWGGDMGEGVCQIQMPFVLQPLQKIAMRVAGVI